MGPRHHKSVDEAQTSGRSDKRRYVPAVSSGTAACWADPVLRHVLGMRGPRLVVHVGMYPSSWTQGVRVRRLVVIVVVSQT